MIANKANAYASKSVQSQAVTRYYDGLCAPFDHEPTSEILEIIYSKSVGEGVVARKKFGQGQTVFKFYGRILTEQTLYTLQIAPGKYVEDPIVMGKVLHSCDPNMVCDVGAGIFKATRPIMIGEYLTMDYDSTEDVLFRSFECQCSAKNCRGLIRGRAFR